MVYFGADMWYDGKKRDVALGRTARIPDQMEAIEHEKNLFEMLKVMFLGIVEGVTEWLPISSTGHMLLVDEFMPLQMTEEFKEMFL